MALQVIITSHKAPHHRIEGAANTDIADDDLEAVAAIGCNQVIGLESALQGILQCVYVKLDIVTELKL